MFKNRKIRLKVKLLSRIQKKIPQTKHSKINRISKINKLFIYHKTKNIPTQFIDYLNLLIKLILGQNSPKNMKIIQKVRTLNYFFMFE